MSSLIILGDDSIQCKQIVAIDNFSQVDNSSPDDIIKLNFDIKLLKKLSTNDIECIVVANSIYEVVFANKLKADYILVPKNITTQAQKIADNYMFDSKIIVSISTKKQLEVYATEGIDGVVFT